MPRVISYVRFSSERQKHGESYRRQIASTLDYCQRHGLILDESFRISDLGVSAYRGKNLLDGALGQFVSAVECGRIEKGTILIVESLDRLSRDTVDEALQLFLRIIGNGITIVTLEPERSHTKTSIGNISGLLEPILIMSRANEESTMKGHRSQKNWDTMIKKARETTTPIGRSCPWWLILEEGKYRLIPERAAVVRTIFEMRQNGHGAISICKKLNNDPKTPKPRFASGWNPSTISAMTKTRTVLGEFQPCQKIDGKKVSHGDLIKNYYPSVIDEGVFYSSQTGGKKAGRVNPDRLNIFKGLLYGTDGQPMHSTQCQQKRGDKTYAYHYLESSGRLVGLKNSVSNRIKPEPFERAFLSFVKEIDPRDFIRGESTLSSKISEIGRIVAGLDATIFATKRAVKDAKVKEAGLKFLMELDAERSIHLETLEALKASLNSNDVEALCEISNLGGMLEDSSVDSLDLRTRIRQRIRQLISRIVVKQEWIGHGVNKKRLYELLVIVTFHDGKTRAFSCDQDGNRLGSNLLIPAGILGDGMESVVASCVKEGNVTMIEISPGYVEIRENDTP